MARPEEQALIEALRRGDQRACHDLVQRYAHRVYNVALRLTGHPDEAEDVLQETFINACRNATRFEGRSSLSTWLYRIATNNGLMRLRRRQPPTVPLEVSVEDEALDFRPRQLHDWRWDPETVVLTEELRQVMEAAIASLPETLRAAFVLRDLEDLSTREAAEVLGISPGALKVRLHRARLLLREQLAAYFKGQPGSGERTHGEQNG